MADLPDMVTTHGRGVPAGLTLLGLLSVFDIGSTFIPAPADVPGPPAEILIIGNLLGLVSLVLVVLMWRGGRGVVGWVLVALRVLSALLAVPAFLVEGVPTVFVVLAAVFLYSRSSAWCWCVRPCAAPPPAPTERSSCHPGGTWCDPRTHPRAHRRVRARRRPPASATAFPRGARRQPPRLSRSPRSSAAGARRSGSRRG